MIAAIPSRNRGWSSTLKTRIRARSLICASRFLLRALVRRNSEPWLREPSPPPIGWRILENDVTRNGKLDFGPGRGGAHHSEFRADSFRPLSHSRESPVCLPPETKQLRLDPATVVADRNPQPVCGVFELHLDAARAGMPEGIDKRLPSDAVNLIANNRLQGVRRALDNDSIRRLVVEAELLGYPSKCELDIAVALRG